MIICRIVFPVLEMFDGISRKFAHRYNKLRGRKKKIKKNCAQNETVDEIQTTTRTDETDSAAFAIVILSYWPCANDGKDEEYIIKNGRK